MSAIRYEGTVGGFREFALREIRKAAMSGMSLREPRDAKKLQRRLRRAMVRDLMRQIQGPKEAA